MFGSSPKVAHMAGFGSVSTPNEVTVTMNDGSVEKVKTKNILIATGSEPVSFPGLEVSYYTTFSLYSYLFVL